MATLSNTILNVDTSIKPIERYIFLTASQFDGGTGEGSFTTGAGADRINVYNALKRCGHHIEIFLREGGGAAGNQYTITLLINAVTKVFPTDNTLYKNPLGQNTKRLDSPVEVPNPSTPIQIISREGEIITRYLDIPNIKTISINGSASGGGSLGEFNILIR